LDAAVRAYPPAPQADQRRRVMLYHAASAPPSSIGRSVKINELHGPAARRGIGRDYRERARGLMPRVLAKSGHTPRHQRRYQGESDRARPATRWAEGECDLAVAFDVHYAQRAQRSPPSACRSACCEAGQPLCAQEGTEIVRSFRRNACPVGQQLMLAFPSKTPSPLADELTRARAQFHRLMVERPT